MTNENSSSQIHFPIQADLPSSEVLIVRDLDVVGVGGVRRHQLEELTRQGRQFIMRTFEAHIPEDLRTIYNEEILRTLKWLRPLKVEAGPTLDLTEAVKEVFGRNFSRTQNYMGVMAKKLCEDYLAEMSWSSWLLQDHWRYLPGFVHHKFPQNSELQEIVHWEWVQAWLDVQAFYYQGLSDPGMIVMNPSFQTVHLSKDSPTLQRSEGLYAFVFSEKSQAIVEKALDVLDAQFMDLLQEDRKFSEQQLLEMLAEVTEIQPAPSASDWKDRLQDLLAKDIVLEVPKI